MGKVPQENVGTGVGDSSRRDFLKGAAALGGSALLPGTLPAQAPAEVPANGARVIDCHFHFASPAFAKALAPKIGEFRAGYNTIAGNVMKRWQEYSPAKAVEYLDRNGVATALLSCGGPGIWFGDPEETRFLARDMNEFGAKMVSDYKGRFGLFGLLPLPSIENSLREIEYALDTLKADGVCIFTSYEEHYWLGDPIFRPVFDELNRRKAVVFVHPMNPFQALTHVGITEFLNDTTRTISSLVKTGAATRYGDIRFMFSHGGGTMPSMIERFEVAEAGAYDEVFARPAEPNSNLFHMRRFFYDTANSANSVQMQGLKTILGGTQNIVFGSDWPLIPTNDLATVGFRQLHGLQTSGLNAKDVAGIRRENVIARLVPRLKESV